MQLLEPDQIRIDRVGGSSCRENVQLLEQNRWRRPARRWSSCRENVQLLELLGRAPTITSWSSCRENVQLLELTVPVMLLVDRSSCRENVQLLERVTGRRVARAGQAAVKMCSYWNVLTWLVSNQVDQAAVNACSSCEDQDNVVAPIGDGGRRLLSFRNPGSNDTFPAPDGHLALSNQD